MAGWHLEYSIDTDVENHVVYEKIFGIWKLDIARAFVRDFESEVAELTGESWAQLIDLTNWKAGYPEIIDIIGRHLAWCRKHKMIWSVNIIRNPSTFKQLTQIISKGGVKGVSKTFRTREEGEQFLRDKGFIVRTVSGNGNIQSPF
ncbi:MAG TPA: hypothetical protein PLF13_07960 [candidate division Zixibacteria bacterium]|nr:hypothetical protein [candidate division Zixibacteria bacterium]